MRASCFGQWDLVSLLFIGILTALVTPFQCNSHPNGRMSLGLVKRAQGFRS